MAAMAPVEEPAAAGTPPRLPTLPVSDGAAIMEAFVDRGTATGASTDRLPVVELRPFMNQEWRPLRSLPDYYDRTATSMSNNSRRGDGGSAGYPDPASLGLLNQKSNEFGSRTSLAERREAPRPRLREGKPVDTSHAGMFVTPLDREQTTLQDMQAKAMGAATGPTTQTASIVRSLTDGELMRLREMRVQGRRMENLPPKLSMLYMTPWEYYRMHRSYEIPIATDPGAAAQNATAIMDELEERYQALENVHIDDNIYDTFDRSNTLPSIRVTNAPTRRKRYRKPRQPSATSSSAPGSAAAPPAYRLGVANSLDVLRHFGRPARVETHLTMHLKHTLNQLRRTHDSQATLQTAAAGMGLLGHASGFGLGRPVGLRTSSTPTYGETMLRVGIQNNAPRISDRNIRAALPSASAPDVLSRATPHVRSEIYGQMPGVEQPEPMPSGPPHSSRSHPGSTGYEQLAQEPMPPPTSAEQLNGNQVVAEDGSVSITPRKSRRSREPQDPTDVSPRDHHSSSSSTKSPRSTKTKSRRSKSRRAEEAKSSTPTADTTASPRRTQTSSVTFQDEQQDGEQLTEQMRTAHSAQSAAPDGRSSKASRPGTRGTPVHIPHSSSGSRNEAHPEGGNEAEYSGAESRGDVHEHVKIGPNGDIQVGGNSVGVIKIGTDGTLTLGNKAMGVVKIGASGNVEIHPCTGEPTTDANDNVGNDVADGNNEDNSTSEPSGRVKTEGDKSQDVDSSDDPKEVDSAGDIGTSAPANSPIPEGDTNSAIVIPGGIDVDPDINTEPVSAGDMEVDPAPVTEASGADNEANGNIGDGDIEPDHEANGNIGGGDIEPDHEANGNIGGGDIEPDQEANGNIVSGDIEPDHEANGNIGGSVIEPGSDIEAIPGDIVVGPDGHLHMAGKSLGAIQFGDNGEIKLGGKTIGAVAMAPDGNIAIKTTAEVLVSSRQSRVSFSPESTGGRQSGRVSTGADLEYSVSAGTAQEEVTGGMEDADVQHESSVEPASDLNNNTGDPILAHGVKTPGGSDPMEEGQQQGTTAPEQSPGEGPSSSPAHTTPVAADIEAAVGIPGEGEQKVATPPGGDAAIRKLHTKSAASKASSGYRGDDVYLTSWDQKTETESVRPETVLTVREEGD